MGYRIETIEVYNFKFFEHTFTLPIKCKNVLLFGENGSGKSSIFWSFYTHYQSVFKTPIDAQKYFLSGNKASLCNKFTAPGTHSGIRITYKDENGHTPVVEDSDTNLSVNSPAARSMMTDTVTSSDFFNYKFLSSIFDFKNSEENELFNVFEREILQYLTLDNALIIGGVNNGKDALTWWNFFKREYTNLPRNRKNYNDFNQNAPEYRAFLSMLSQFNGDMRSALSQLIISANQILRDDFKIPAQLTVRYIPATFNERIPGTTRSRDRVVTAPQIILNAKMVHADIANQEIQHPNSFFNEAKLTCMALALRLAVLNGKPTEGVTYASTLFVDDLLISLDMNYRRKVVEILLNSAVNRQLLFFTHDRSLFYLVKEELSARKVVKDWLFYELYSKIENGHPTPELITPTTPIEEAKVFLHEHRIAACANALRRACEKELRRLLPYNKQLKKDPQELQTIQLLDLNGLICNFEKMRRDLGMPDIAHGLSSDRRLLLNPFSHDDIETPFYKEELGRLINCCERLSAISRTNVVTADMTHNEICRITVSHNGHTAEATFIFNEIMVCYEMGGVEYITNPRIKVLTCSSDASFVGKEKGLAIVYSDLYNSVSLNASTCPKLKTVLYKPDGSLLM